MLNQDFLLDYYSQECQDIKNDYNHLYSLFAALILEKVGQKTTSDKLYNKREYEKIQKDRRGEQISIDIPKELCLIAKQYKLKSTTNNDKTIRVTLERV